MGRIAGLSAAETRERLLDAAAVVFAERGFEGARTTEIARRAGLSTGAIYSQFGTKAELLLEAIRSFAPSELDRLLAGEIDDAESFVDLVTSVAASLPYKPKALVALLLEAMSAGRRDPEVAATLASASRDRETLIVRTIQGAQATGELDPNLSAAAMARLSFTLVLGSLAVQGLDLDPPDPDEWTAVIKRLVASMQDPTKE